MPEKENKIANWNESYENFKTTYSEVIDSPANLANTLQYEFVREDIERFLSPSKDLKILECGCGGARTSLYLAKRGFKVICSDYAPEAIRLAKDNFESAKASGTFLQDDLLSSKIPDNSFDCVMSFGLLEHFKDLSPILASVTKLTKSGGIQIHCIIPKKLSTQTFMNFVLYPYRFAKNVFSGRFEQIITKSFRDFPHYENKFSAKEYCRAFEREGNEILRCEAGGIVFPFLILPLGIGVKLVRAFPDFFVKLIRKTDRTQSRFLHVIAPTFYIVCRKSSSTVTIKK